MCICVLSGSRSLVLCPAHGPRVPPQGSSQRRQSATQAPGPAGHGAAAQAVALQAPRQPLPHQDREDPAGPRLANDPGPGESALCLLFFFFILDKIKAKVCQEK